MKKHDVPRLWDLVIACIICLAIHLLMVTGFSGENMTFNSDEDHYTRTADNLRGSTPPWE